MKNIIIKSINIIHDLRIELVAGCISSWIGMLLACHISNSIYPQDFILPEIMSILASIAWITEFIETIKYVNKTEE